MLHVIAILAVFAAGFGAGRVHHISSLKAKLSKLESVGSADLKAAIASLKALLHIK